MDVTNTGSRAGKEIVQLYIHHENPTLQKPEKELKAFRKVALEPGEVQTVTFRLKRDQFASFDEKLGCFAVEPGVYTLMAGDSSRNITAQKRIAIRCPDPYGYREDTRIATIWADPRCVELYVQYFGDKHGADMYNDLLGWTPDYPTAKALRERIPDRCYSSKEEKEAAIKEFFYQLSLIDLGKVERL